MNSQDFISDLNTRYFDGQLSSAFMDELKQLPIDRPDVFAFVERMFSFMNEAGIPARDMSTLIGEILGTLLARILPGAWEGRVPPITIPGRHAVIDQYIKSNSWSSYDSKTMLDIGCGFPPYTTLDTAKYLPDWHITGADPSLPVYLVYDETGNYATFDEDKSTIYFQPSLPTIDNWKKLLENASETRNRFEKLLNRLLEGQVDVQNGFPKFEHDPTQTYSSEMLAFKRLGIGQGDYEPKSVIRCFNVLFYFDDTFYANALKWFAQQTEEGGLVLIGANWAVSTECYYNVYQNVRGELINREFVFGLDCICPVGIVSWYANYDDDRQTKDLAKYVRMIRQNEAFMKSFYHVHDAQRKEYGICPRDGDGYYGIVDPSIKPQEMWALAGKLLDGLNESGLNQQAADVLKAAGFDARVNEVGHIAVKQ